MKADKVLFILKSRETYGENEKASDQWKNRNHTGLRNSVRYVVDMLNNMGISALYSIVRDNNDIDREVTKHKPSHVIIEALWVVPSKMEVLTRLHPSVHWLIRLHSEIPFIAQEGIAMEWIFDYVKYPHVHVTSNSLRMCESLEHLLRREIPFTPNYYPLRPLEPLEILEGKYINVGCFGAIRPLKNQLMQAVAAIRFADEHRYLMRFHINADRVEGGGLPVLHNIKALFKNSHHELFENDWLDADNFHKLVKNMDIGMQVSFSETFNIVSADLAIANIPLVASKEVAWVNSMFQADPTSESDILAKMHVAWAGRYNGLQKLNYEGLARYDQESQANWLYTLGHK